MGVEQIHVCDSCRATATSENHLRSHSCGHLLCESCKRLMAKLARTHGTLGQCPLCHAGKPFLTVLNEKLYIRQEYKDIINKKAPTQMDVLVRKALSWEGKFPYPKPDNGLSSQEMEDGKAADGPGGQKA